jgi:hypothetical protein
MKAPQGLLIWLMLAVSCAAQEDHSAALQKRADEAKGVQCARLSMQAARQVLEEANHYFGEGIIQAARNSVDRSVYYARRSVDCTLQTRKGEKTTEIEIRAMIRRMNDILRTLDSDDRPPMKKSIAVLEEQRDRVLRAMFGAAAGKATSEKKP